MQNLQFPIKFTFKISTISNDFSAVDASGKTVAYVREKLFRLKKDILIYSDESKSEVNYQIKADRWLDFSAAYSFYRTEEAEQKKSFGKIARKGWRSIWKANYELIDQFEEVQYHINEENAWVKVWDSLLGEVPILGLFTGYLFNPAYIVTNKSGEAIIRLKKQPSFWGRKFEVEKLSNIDSDDDERIILGLMMMILLEKRRG